MNKEEDQREMTEIKTNPIVSSEIKEINSWSSFWQFLDSKQGQYVFGLMKSYVGNSWANTLVKAIFDIIIIIGIFWFLIFLADRKYIDGCTLSTVIGTVIGYVLSNRFGKSS